jgi:hypothetical protein
MVRLNNADERNQTLDTNQLAKFAAGAGTSILEICAIKAVVPVLTGHSTGHRPFTHWFGRFWPLFRLVLLVLGLVRCDGGMESALCPKRLQASSLIKFITNI